MEGLKQAGSRHCLFYCKPSLLRQWHSYCSSIIQTSLRNYCLENSSHRQIIIWQADNGKDLSEHPGNLLPGRNKLSYSDILLIRSSHSYLFIWIPKRVCLIPRSTKCTKQSCVYSVSNIFSLLRNQLSLSMTCARNTNMGRLVPLLASRRKRKKKKWLPETSPFVLKKVWLERTIFLTQSLLQIYYSDWSAKIK